MNGTQIMNQVITYETEELSSIKLQMASFLDGMMDKIAPAKANGVNELNLKVMADTAIRRQMDRILNGKTNYTVQRNGQTAILGIEASVKNEIVELFNRQI